MYNSGLKQCIKCDVEKLIEDYYYNKTKGCYFNTCKNCIKEINKKYYLNNPEKLKEKRKKWVLNNPEKNKEIKKKWKENNPDYNKKYYLNNLDKVKERNKNYNKKRRKEDPTFKLTYNLRNRLSNALKRNIKSNSTINLIGSSIKDLKIYLENQFDESMSWDNYGSYWEVDHIIPCSSFNFSIEEEQKKCFHWTNLQPLSTEDNRQKSNKLNWVKNNEN